MYLKMHAGIKDNEEPTVGGQDMKDNQARTGRFAADAGIAIGPILFIIAILGILAAAIAAGSGSFTAGTSNESSSTKAAALIQIGENLRVGMDRITMEGGITVPSVVTNVSTTNASDDLFSPSGGGIAPPSVSLANVVGTDVWEFPSAAVPGVGTTTGSIVAMLSIPQTVCDAVNSKANGMTNATNYNTTNFGNNVVGTANLGTLVSGTSWPANFDGKMIGCVYNASDSKYWFYQVIAVQ
jgi:hypothetical protein